MIFLMTPFFLGYFILRIQYIKLGLFGWLGSKESTSQCRRLRRCGFDPWVGKVPWRRKWQSTPIFFPAKSNNLSCRGTWRATVHGVAKESDMTEHEQMMFPGKILPSCQAESRRPVRVIGRVRAVGGQKDQIPAGQRHR